MMMKKRGILLALVFTVLLSGCSKKLQTDELLKEGSGGNINAFLCDKDGKFISKLRDGDSKETRDGDTIIVRAPYSETSAYVAGGTLLEEREDGITIVITIQPEFSGDFSYIEVEVGEKQMGFKLKK